jgi:hypothetical protein
MSILNFVVMFVGARVELSHGSHLKNLLGLWRQSCPHAIDRFSSSTTFQRIATPWNIAAHVPRAAAITAIQTK